MASTRSIRPWGRTFRDVGIVVVLAIAVVVGASFLGPMSAGTGQPRAPSGSQGASRLTARPAVDASVSIPKTTSAPTTAPVALLGPGSTGRAVLKLQQRLASIGYWLGTPDATFADSTEQAVYALQKTAGLEVDGIGGPKTTAALARGILPRPRSSTGHVIEVDLEHDLPALRHERQARRPAQRPPPAR